MKKSQRVLSLLLAAVLLLGLLPAPAWSGQLLNVWVPLGEQSVL